MVRFVEAFAARCRRFRRNNSKLWFRDACHVLLRFKRAPKAKSHYCSVLVLQTWSGLEYIRGVEIDFFSLLLDLCVRQYECSLIKIVQALTQYICWLEIFFFM